MINTFIIRLLSLTFAAKFNTKDLDRKIRVGAVSYLNTKPLLYGILRSDLVQDIELITDYPSRIATMLLDDRIDIGLVPVAIIPQMREYYFHTDFCIGADGPVGSVCLFSETKIDQIDRILLDYQSRTSAELVRILLNLYWKTSPDLIDAQEDFCDQIKGRTGAVVIGDRALQQRKVSTYIYDLGEAWKNLTGLPFVFAAWISNKPLDPVFVERFNQANSVGVNDLGPVLQGLHSDVYDLKRYFTQNISYHFDESKKAGLRKFLQLIKPVVVR
jgi:chorismate dehydratase